MKENAIVIGLVIEMADKLLLTNKVENHLFLRLVIKIADKLLIADKVENNLFLFYGQKVVIVLEYMP